MECPNCKKEMELHDTTYSNVNTERCHVNQHTGDIYKCENCNEYIIDNLISGKTEKWNY